jgi:hypothetical protein
MTFDSEYDVEPVPEEDAAEQGRPVTDEPADDLEREPVDPTQEADPADVEEQRRVVPDDEEYEPG